MSDTSRMDRFLQPGTPVRLINHVEDSWEDGVVVHCWLDEEIGVHDCYVAFFGDAIPKGPPTVKPYVLRYAATSLTMIEPASAGYVGHELVMGSDVADRDGMYLELNDGSTDTMPLGEVFYSDIDGSMTVSTFGNSLPLDAVEWMIAEAKRLLPPTK